MAYKTLLMVVMAQILGFACAAQDDDTAQTSEAHSFPSQPFACNASWLPAEPGWLLRRPREPRLNLDMQNCFGASIDPSSAAGAFLFTGASEDTSPCASTKIPTEGKSATVDSNHFSAKLIRILEAAGRENLKIIAWLPPAWFAAPPNIQRIEMANPTVDGPWNKCVPALNQSLVVHVQTEPRVKLPEQKLNERKDQCSQAVRISPKGVHPNCKRALEDLFKMARATGEGFGRGLYQFEGQIIIAGHPKTEGFIQAFSAGVKHGSNSATSLIYDRDGLLFKHYTDYPLDTVPADPCGDNTAAANRKAHKHLIDAFKNIVVSLFRHAEGLCQSMQVLDNNGNILGTLGTFITP